MDSVKALTRAEIVKMNQTGKWQPIPVFGWPSANSIGHRQNLMWKVFGLTLVPDRTCNHIKVLFVSWDIVSGSFANLHYQYVQATMEPRPQAHIRQNAHLKSFPSNPKETTTSIRIEPEPVNAKASALPIETPRPVMTISCLMTYPRSIFGFWGFWWQSAHCHLTYCLLMPSTHRDLSLYLSKFFSKLCQNSVSNLSK